MDFTNTDFAPGWEGGFDVVLADAARTVRAETDLLVDFDGTLSDQAGHYGVRNNGVKLVNRPRRFGSGAAGFDGTNTVAYLPGAEALFRPDTQPGSFSIDLWLYPNHVTEGAVILRWRGALLNGASPVLQDLRLEINDRRLHWILTNLVVRADSSGTGRVETTAPVHLSGRRSLIPRLWGHHQLRYDASTGQLAYRIDGIPEDIRYLSDSGREDGTSHAILFGHDTGDGIVLGERFQGAMDELRITRSVTEGPQPSRFSGVPGRVLSRPIDLGGSGAHLRALETRTHEPGGTEVRAYYRIADVVVSNDPRNALDAEWQAVAEDGTIPGNVRGRFLQMRYDLLADAARDESPRLREIVVRYNAAAAPPPPRYVTGRPVPGGVEITWDAVLQGEVRGYQVYFGERPGRYTGAAGLKSPRDAGSSTRVVIEGLEPDVPYVFAVETYDRYGQAGPLSREVEVRAGRGSDAR